MLLQFAKNIEIEEQKCSPVSFFVGQNALFPLRSFSQRKNGALETIKPPAMRVVGIALAYSKKTSSAIISAGSPTALIITKELPV